MSPITTHDFQSEQPLHPAAQDLLLSFFNQGWPDPSKIHHQSAKLRNLLGSAREVIAANLGIKNTELEIVGELGFAFELGISGLLNPLTNSDTQESTSLFAYSGIDRQIVHAFARKHKSNGGEIHELKVNSDGLVQYSTPNECAVLSWQSTNRETGVIQQDPSKANCQAIFADMTASFPLSKLPERWDSAVWDPRFFGGPQGIAFLGISQNSKWQKPGPDLDQRRVYGSFSKPLLLASAVALENWVQNAKVDYERIKILNSFARQVLKKELREVLIAGEAESSDPRFLAFCLPNAIAEEVLRKLEVMGFLVDAGSACSSGPLSPSHVLTAMGFPEQGIFRLTFRADQKEGTIADLVKGIAASA